MMLNCSVIHVQIFRISIITVALLLRYQRADSVYCMRAQSWQGAFGTLLTPQDMNYTPATAVNKG